MSEKYGIASRYTDYADMIDHGDVDALIVSVPDDLRYAITLRAIDANLPVLCEKPFALIVAEARAMYDEAQAVGVPYMVLFTYRWLPFFQYFRDLAKQDIVGRLYHAEFRYMAAYARRADYVQRQEIRGTP